IYLGAVFLNNFNPLTGLLRLIDTYVIKALSDPSHIEIIVFTCLFGGVVGLISKSGGTKGMADLITRFAKKRKSGLLSTWLMGIAIFFDDYANTLIVGNLMRPITDKMRISREKLSFIVDATSAPVVSLFVVSSWIGYEIGLIQHGLSMVGSTENAYDVFLQTIPYRFYPILMLIFVFMVSYFERDFGPMYKAEKRATEKGKVLRDGAKVGSITEKSELFGNEDKARWYNAVVPILVLIIGTIAGLYYTGITSLAQQGITEYGIRDIIGNSDSYIALLWSSFAACGVAAIMIVSQKIMNISDTLDAWFLGVRSMLLALIILTLAWAIGSITQDIKTADFLIGIIGDSISPRFLPVIVFIVCALTSFATGTSWGTMAILMPIVIPLATVVPSFYHYSPMNSEIILHGVISSVLAGSVFGDHCSPISDTTILSSMASGCDHIDHVRTQLPYAVVVAVFCMLIGDIPTAYGFSPYYSIIIIAALLAAIVYFFGKKVTYNISETG
ncbi:MAG: Na+/H+ antiporter NhaC family protein, partial [Ignavibacteriaceae bacterium]